MAFRRFKRRKFRRRFKRSFNRRGIRKLKKFVRAKQSKNWRVPRNNLAAENTFIKIRSQYHIALSNETNLAYKDYLIVANGLSPEHVGSSADYQSPPLWELGTLYSKYHIWKSKIRMEFVSKMETIESIQSKLITEKICYAYPSIQDSQEDTGANVWGWRVDTPAKFNNPASVAKCHYKMFTEHEFTYGNRHSCIVKNQQKTKRMFNFPVKQEDYTGSLFSHGTIGTAPGSQDILVTNPLQRWYWHIGIINVDQTDVAIIEPNTAVLGEALVTLDTYVRLFAPRVKTQYAQING